MNDVVIVSAFRTPVGRHGGVLSEVRPDDLAALVIREIVSARRLIQMKLKKCTWVVLIRRVRITEMSPEWPRYLLVCQTKLLRSPSIDFAPAD